MTLDDRLDETKLDKIDQEITDELRAAYPDYEIIDDQKPEKIYFTIGGDDVPMQQQQERRSR